MTLGLSLPGKYPVSGLLVKGPSPAEWLASLKEWISKREGDELVSLHVVEGPDGEVLMAHLHPFSEELQVSCPRTGEVLLAASTGSCGPGYHQHVVELAHAMASELKVTWRPGDAGHGDDTGFFGTGDREALESAMIEDVAEAARELAPALDEAPTLLLPPSAPLFLSSAAVLTPLGPRDEAWLASVREGDARALDAMPWRARGRDGAHFRDRALALAWCEARWREPSNEAEEGVLREIVRCLGRARELGETALPWSAWREIAGYLGESAPEPPAGGSKGDVPVGYRRGDVRARLPGDFSVRIPGHFAEDLDEDGTWHATDGTRSVYVNAGRVPNAADGPGDAVRLLARATFEGEPFEFRGRRAVGKAGLRRDEDDEGPAFVLACGAAEGSYMLRATIVYRGESDRDWALATFRSIDRAAPGASVRTGGLPGITG